MSVLLSLRCKDDARADEICRRVQRTNGARGVQIAWGNVLMGDQMDFLVGTATEVECASGMPVSDVTVRWTNQALSHSID
jgi:hypothetical protein